MSDTNPGLGPDASQQRASVEPSETAKRQRELELAFQFARGATFVVMALLTTGLGALGTGAINTRDMSNANAARLVVVEKAQADMAAQAREVATEARATHDAIVRMTSAMESLSTRVDTLTTELRTRDSEHPARR